MAWMNPLPRRPPQHLQVPAVVRQQIEQPRLRGLAGQTLLQYPLTWTIPSCHPQGRIMRQAIQVVLGTITQRQAVDPLPQQFTQRITNQVRLSRVRQLTCQRISQSQAMIGFPQQQRSAVRGESIVASLDLDSTIERGLEKRPFAFTHHVNLLARLSAPLRTATDSQINENLQASKKGCVNNRG
jgi:hypothetical protein